MIERISQAYSELMRSEAQETAARERVAQWMIAHGYATGHGDTLEDLLGELEWQVVDRGAAETIVPEFTAALKRAGDRYDQQCLTGDGTECRFLAGPKD